MERPVAMLDLDMEDRPPAAAEDRGQRGPATPGSRLFTVRLWREQVAEGSEYRGSVRDVVTGAFRSFRNWSAMAEFMVARMEDDGAARASFAWPSGSGRG